MSLKRMMKRNEKKQIHSDLKRKFRQAKKKGQVEKNLRVVPFHQFDTSSSPHGEKLRDGTTVVVDEPTLGWDDEMRTETPEN